MTADTTRELIKEKFLPFSKLPWIDFNKGDAEVNRKRIFKTKKKQKQTFDLGVGSIERSEYGQRCFGESFGCWKRKIDDSR